MQCYMLGLSYKTADVEVREQVAFSRTLLPAALGELCRKESVRGAVILSTCNRMEIYVDADDPVAAREDICTFISESRGLPREAFENSLYERTGLEVAHHLLSVIASLDSMVLGEQQISGQIRTAYKQAVEAGSCTMVLGHLFRQALACGKLVRNQTSISESHVSVSTVAIDLVREKFDSFEDKTVLVIGSGEMSELAARYLRELGVSSFIVSSRTYAHASKLAEELGGQARYYEDLESLVGMADIIISSTAAPHCILGPSLFASRRHPLFILDIALPRDVDPAVRALDNVTLYDLDDISARIDRNRTARKSAAQEARLIVESETNEFEKWMAEHAVVPIVRRMRQDAEDIRAREVGKLLKLLDADLSDADRALVDKATQVIVKKLLHTPTLRLKETVENNTSFQAAEAVRYLCGYSEGIVSHAHAMDSGMVAASSTLPPHASFVHDEISRSDGFESFIPAGHPDVGVSMTQMMRMVCPHGDAACAPAFQARMRDVAGHGQQQSGSEQEAGQADDRA